MDHVKKVAKQRTPSLVEERKRNSDERVQMFRGALHTKELEVLRDLLGVDEDQFSYRQSTKPVAVSEKFSPEAMTTVLAGLECRKAFDDVQWAVEKYKATLSKTWTDEERLSPYAALVERAAEKETKREIEAQMGSLKGWLSYQLSARQLAASLNVAFPCPVDHLVKHAVAAAKDVNSRERPMSSPHGTRQNHSANNSSNNMQKLAAQKAAEKHRAQQSSSPTAFASEKLPSDIKPMQPVGPAPSSTPQRPKRMAGVVADHSQTSTPVEGGRKAAGSMVVPNSTNFRKGSPMRGLSSSMLTSGGKLDEEDSGDEQEPDTPRRLDESSRARLVGRGESVRSSMNRVMMEDSVASARLAENSVDRTDRLLVHVTSRIPFAASAQKSAHHHRKHHHGHSEPSASEAMTVALWWQNEEERLKVSLVNITG
jgi:hypothetical protein